jgi:hypothetical protein
VNYLTKHEQTVLCVVIGLLLVGWMVRAYRQAHPPSNPVPEAIVGRQAKP